MADEIAGPEQARLFSRIALRTWKATVGRFDDIVSALSDEELEREVAPGKSRLFYLVGHLTALHDRLLPALGLGERRYADLDAEFGDERDDHHASALSPRRLRQLWNEVNAALVAGMERLTPEQWLEAPASVAAPSRLSALLAWTAHVSLHATQMRITR